MSRITSDAGLLAQLNVYSRRLDALEGIGQCETFESFELKKSFDYLSKINDNHLVIDLVKDKQQL